MKQMGGSMRAGGQTGQGMQHMTSRAGDAVKGWDNESRRPDGTGYAVQAQAGHPPQVEDEGGDGREDGQKAGKSRHVVHCKAGQRGQLTQLRPGTPGMLAASPKLQSLYHGAL